SGGTPALRRREWRERSMDRVFDEYLRFLRESGAEEDSSTPDAGPAGGKPRGRASLAVKRFRKATKGARKSAPEDDEGDDG
ncbi:MAG TPA: hypothetical protein VI893_04815, partial [Thermoplasmata archaeon]|nr:hypothetical protein [Thermoplasmata archaeon]